MGSCKLVADGSSQCRAGVPAMAASAKMPTVEVFCSSQGLEGIWKERAKRLVAEVPEERASKLAEFRERINLLSEELEGLAGSKLLKEESFLVRFLRGSNWDVDIGAGLIAGSHQMIQDYYPYMSAGPPSALEHVWRRDLIFSPEMRDDEGRRVVVLRLGQWPPQEVPLFDFFTGVFTLFELVVQEERTQVAGVVMVLDCKGFGLSHVRNFNMDMVMCINSFLCGAFPLWFRRIHIVNNPMLFSVFGKLVGPLLSSRVRENIVYHSSELSSLHSEVHPSLLPTSLGGSQDDKGGEAAWVVAARQRDSDYKEKIRQAGQMLRGAGGRKEANVSDCGGRQPEGVPA